MAEKSFTSRVPLERRTVTHAELALWNAESNRDNVRFMHYWESKEVLEQSDPGDEYIVFVGRSDVMTAKIWTFLDYTTPHKAFILRPDAETRYELSEKEGILLRFQFRGEVRIFNKNGLKALLDAVEMSVFQRADDVIIRIDVAKAMN